MIATYRMVEEGVADLLAEALLCRKSSGGQNEMVHMIHKDSIGLIFVFKRVVEASVCFSIILRFLTCFERRMCRYYPILFLDFFQLIVYDISYEKMITIFSVPLYTYERNKKICLKFLIQSSKEQHVIRYQINIVRSLKMCWNTWYIK